MAALAQILALLLLVHVTTSTLLSADKKCLPMQWESAVVGTAAMVIGGKGQVFAIDAMVAADYSKSVEALIENVYSEGKFVGSYKIMYTEKNTYFINLEKLTCTMHPGFKLRQVCSDDPALSLVNSYTLGEQMTDTYQVLISAAGATGAEYLTFTRDTFIIVSQVLQLGGTSERSGLLDSLQFGNVTQGIKDPSIFEVPDYCNLAKYQKEDIGVSAPEMIWLGLKP